DPAGARPVDDRGDEKVVDGLDQDVAVGRRAAEDRPVQAQEIEADHRPIAAIALHQEARLVAQVGPKRAEAGDTRWAGQAQCLARAAVIEKLPAAMTPSPRARA